MRSAELLRLLPCALWVAAAAALAPRAAADEGKDTFYRYTDKNGRVVITNAEGQVPLQQRDAARMDLSHVSLNSELARELDAQLEQEHEALIETPYCEQAREAAQVSVPQQVWDEYGLFLVCGGLLLLLALFTPFALKRVGAPAWAKVLSFAIPTLAVVAFMGFTLNKAQQRVSALKQAAVPCQKETFAELAAGTDPLAAHQALIERLRYEVERARGDVTRPR